MLPAATALIVAYAIGSVPVAYLAGRLTAGVDLRGRGSGNPGASNVWQSVSKWLVVPVGVAQIGQGLAAVLVARAFDQGDGVQAACGVAAVVANDWNPWLKFDGGRGIGATIGVLLALAWEPLVVFIVVSAVGVPRFVPQEMAVALAFLPVSAVAFGYDAAIVVGLLALSLVAFAKRLLANGPPEDSSWRDAWLNRLWLDRDIQDREAWVRR
jgi:acyl phosphate:glycerol-3-phosphate acyltransferase